MTEHTPDPPRSTPPPAGGGRTPVGFFEHDPAADAWSWSDEIYEIHGFRPGELVVTTELILTHKHPDDRPAAADLLAEVRRTARPFGLYHRIYDARGQQRYVVTVGRSEAGPDGAVARVRGLMADISFAREAELRPYVQEALGKALKHRQAIEQAKGIVMAHYRVDADAAFRMLQRYSQNHNVKLRATSSRIASSTTSDDVLLPLLRALAFPDGDAEGSPGADPAG